MTIYGEFLFLENALSGAVILILTGRLCDAKRGHHVRVASGSILCGAYAFVLLVDLHWAVSLIMKAAFSAGVTALVFRPQTGRSFLKTVSVFYVVSFLMGGITIALMYMAGMQGVTGGGGVYVYGITYLQILAGILVTLAAGSFLADHLREKAHREAVTAEAIIHIGDCKMKLMALVDTGNSLQDPASGNPAAVMSKSAAGELLDMLGKEPAERCCVIPYRAVGKKGVMYGLRPDCIEYGGVRTERIVLAFAEEDFAPWKGIVKYDLLLHQQLFEGRI